MVFFSSIFFLTSTVANFTCYGLQENFIVYKNGKSYLEKKETKEVVKIYIDKFKSTVVSNGIVKNIKTLDLSNNIRLIDGNTLWYINRGLKILIIQGTYRRTSKTIVSWIFFYRCL